MKRSATVNVVSGDHGLNIGPYDDPVYGKLNMKNIILANSSALFRLKTVSGIPD